MKPTKQELQEKKCKYGLNKKSCGLNLINGYCSFHNPQAPQQGEKWEELTSGMNENIIKEWSVRFATNNSKSIVLKMCIALIDAVIQQDIIKTKKKDY